ncbi:hypothetical protein IAI27_11175, partial [Streptococcus pseudopneumoniae]|uniref:hypothetical protein n=1 Tax=Streptococcus pseudopneumoniae TaxID=257758 RepID=UPI0018B055EE
APQNALAEAAARLPEDNPVRRAHDGDIAAQREVAAGLGFGDDPAIKGLIDHNAVARHQDSPHASLVDRGDGMQRLLDAMRREV